MTTTKKNIVLNTLYNLIILFYPLVMAPYVSRVLGAEGLGVYTYTHSIAYFFALLSLLGINNYGNRSISMLRDDKERLNNAFNSIFLMQMITALLSLTAYILSIQFFDKENKLIFIIQAIYVVSSLFDINWLFLGLELFKLTIMRNFVARVASLALVFVFVKDPGDLALYTVIMSSGVLISQLLMWPLVGRYVNFKIPKLSACIPHIKPNLIFFIPVTAVSLYKYTSKIMLGVFSAMHEVGLYENSERAVWIPLSLITAFNTVMLPKMSNIMAKGESERAKRYIYKSMQIIMILSCAIAFGTAAIGKEFAPFFFGAEFADAGILIVLLCPSVLANSWSSVIRTQYLIPNLREKIYVGAVVAGAVVNLAVNYILIRIYGAIGAVVGTIAAEFTVAAYQTVAVRKELTINLYFVKTLPYILFGMIMFAVVRVITHFYSGSGAVLLFIQMFSGAAVYLSLIFIFLALTKNDILNDLLAFIPVRIIKRNGM